MDKLAEAYFFKNLDASELAAVETITRIITAAEGSFILRQGETSDELYIVRTGSVRVLVPVDAADPGEPRSTDAEALTTLGPGECFGEFAFVDLQPSSASVVAREDSSLYAISHADLEVQLLSNPMTAAKFYRAMVDILVRRFRNTDLELAMRKR